MQTNGFIAADADSNLTLEDFPNNSILSLVWNTEDFGEINDFHKLLDFQDEVIAYCIDSEKGYIIYDKSTVIEFSTEATSPSSEIEDCYYFGPLDYYVKDGDTFVHIRTNDKVSKEDVHEESMNFQNLKAKEDVRVDNISSSIDVTESSFYSLNTSTTINANSVVTQNSLPGGTCTNKAQLSHPLATYDWNTDNTCGSLALTIIMDYGHKYWNNYTLKPTYANNRYSLYTYLKEHIQPEYHQAGYEGIDGYNNYSSSVLSNGNKIAHYDDEVSWGFIFNQIKLGKPGSLLTHNHASFGNHWIITSGVYQVSNGQSGVINYYIVNDGWGKTML